jgi:hypothetical protein
MYERLHTLERERDVRIRRERIRGLEPPPSAPSFRSKHGCMRTVRVTVLHPSGAKTAKSVRMRWKRKATVASTPAGERCLRDGPQRRRDVRCRVARQQRRIHHDVIVLELRRCTAAWVCGVRRTRMRKGGRALLPPPRVSSPLFVVLDGLVSTQMKLSGFMHI